MEAVKKRKLPTSCAEGNCATFKGFICKVMTMRISVEDNDFPILETERLWLRPLTPADTDFVFQHFSDPAVTQYLMDEPPVTAYAQAEAIVQFYQDPAGKNYNRWGLIRKSDQQLIGTCGYHKWEKRYCRAEIGYDLGVNFWGHGYMAEALRIVFHHGFACMNLNRIEALVYVGNDRSLRLLRQLGFKQEGVLRDYFYLAGKFYDHALLSLLRREWQA